MQRRFDALGRQAEIYLGPVQGRAARVPVAFEALERAARRRMSSRAFDYLAGGAGAEETAARNRQAFDRYPIVPRVLRGVTDRDLSVELLGRKLPAPLLLAPIGVLEAAHAGADVEAARAAASLGIPMIFSSQASRPMEECAAVMGDAPRWFQLYWSRLDSVVESLVGRAEACGCEAIVLTLDTTLLGWRVRDLSHPYLPFLEGRGIAQYTSDPAFLQELERSRTESSVAAPDTESVHARSGGRTRLTAAALRMLLSGARNTGGGLLRNLRTGRARRAVAQFINTYSRPSIGWQEADRLRAMTRLPVILKGVLHPEDARIALRHAVDGIIVSNHGGRQIDGEIAALKALPAVVAALRDSAQPDGSNRSRQTSDSAAGPARRAAATGRNPIPVLFDSGIRSGTDVFKAIALGADAVCIGRPYAYALAVAGHAGVEELVRNFAAELELTMALCGIPEVSRIVLMDPT
ncbi:alpha-hydroxy-acid oxidizing protein [Salinispira pacifica]